MAFFGESRIKNSQKFAGAYFLWFHCIRTCARGLGPAEYVKIRINSGTNGLIQTIRIVSFGARLLLRIFRLKLLAIPGPGAGEPAVMDSCNLRIYFGPKCHSAASYPQSLWV